MMGRERVVALRDRLPDVVRALRQAVDGAARRGEDLAGAREDLPRDEERHEHVREPREVALPAHEVVLVAAVGVARRVGVVLEQVDLARQALVLQALLRVRDEPLEDALAGPVVRDQLAHVVALRRRVLGVRADVEVQPRAVAQEHVRRPAPRDDLAEQVARDLVGRQPATVLGGAGHAVLGLQAEDPPVHRRAPSSLVPRVARPVSPRPAGPPAAAPASRRNVRRGRVRSSTATSSCAAGIARASPPSSAGRPERRGRPARAPRAASCPARQPALTQRRRGARPARP